MKRARASKLVARDDDTYRVNRRNLVEFVVHGVRYAFPAERSVETRGIPTAHAHPLLRAQFAETDELPPVWPSAHGKTRGLGFEPLYAGAPAAAAQDDELYAMLAFIDAIRGGRARERAIAAELFESTLRREPLA
jgi:hypothetical protein